MNPERFVRLKDLLIEAAGLPTEERQKLLDRACKDDPELRREAESLLAHDQAAAAALLDDPGWIGSRAGAAARSGSLSGSTIAHYRVGELLGEGGMGEVYRAEDTRLGRAVALKFLRADVVGRGESRERFIREARAAAALDHPNIRTIYAIEEWEGTLFLAMACVEGCTLKERIARGKLTVDEAIGIAAQIAAGLQAAHDRGIIHRDIKSSNIMLTTEGRAEIMDFGLARSAGQSDITRTGAVMGTVAYMSPEQASGGTADHRSDIWSLGVVLSEMLTGEMPFRGANDASVIYAILHAEPATPAIPADLERVRLAALAKDPAARYQRVADLAADLEAVRVAIGAGGGAASRAPTILRAPGPREPGSRKATILDVSSRVRTGSSRLPTAWRVAALIAAVVILIAIALRSFAPRRGSAPAPVLQSQSLRVTTARGEEARPAISPDGGRIAYSAMEEGASTADIFVVDVHGGNPLKLTSDPATDDDPEWCPDGSAIVFVSDRQHVSSIWRVGQLGGGELCLVPNATDPSVSPDGAKIAFVRPSAEGWSRVMVAALDDPSKAIALTATGDGLWNHRYPSWSPDGKNLCYAARDGIWVVSAEGGKARNVAASGDETSNPCWSSDGERIYFGAGAAGTRALWDVEVASGKVGRLTLGSGQETHPTVSRDGRRLAYCTFQGRYCLVLRDLESGVDRELPGLPADTQAALAPDEKSLVYVRKMPGGRSDLWLQPLVNDQPAGPSRRLTEQAGMVAQPSFSPDGRFVACYQFTDKARNIWVVPTTGGNPSRITADSTQNIHPVWSPDGGRIAYASRRDTSCSIWTIPMQDGAAAGSPERVTGDEMTAFAPSWSPDGSLIAFCGYREGGVEVWVKSPDGKGAARQITHGAGAAKVRWDAAVPGAMLVMGDWGGGGYKLRRVFLDGRAPEDLRPPIELNEDASLVLFDVSPKGRLLAYFRDRDPRSDIWLLESAAGSY